MHTKRLNMYNTGKAKGMTLDQADRLRRAGVDRLHAALRRHVAYGQDLEDQVEELKKDRADLAGRCKNLQEGLATATKMYEEENEARMADARKGTQKAQEGAEVLRHKETGGTDKNAENELLVRENKRLRAELLGEKEEHARTLNTMHKLASYNVSLKEDLDEALNKPEVLALGVRYMAGKIQYMDGMAVWHDVPEVET